MKRLGIVTGLIISTLLASCAAAQPDLDQSEGALTIENPYAPQAEDEALIQGNVYLEESLWNEAEKTLTITGNLPNPCSRLRVAIAQNTTQLDFAVYSVMEADIICAQMLEPFKASFKMDSFTSQTFRVFINGQELPL